MRMPKHQQGVALIVVLLVVALIAVIATNITSRNQLSIRRTMNIAQYDQAYWYALSAEELAIKVLKQDLDDSKDSVHRQQYWAQVDVVFPVEGGQIAGKIHDMQACFNLNAVSAPMVKNANGQETLSIAALQFQGLLVALGMDEFAAERLTYTLKDYIDEDSIAGAYGAEDSDYESRKVPYRAANTLLSHKSELRAVLGFNQDVYLKLSPYVCAIPGEDRQQLNVNTLETEQAVILAGMLNNQISVAEAENIIGERPSDGFETNDDFWAVNALASLELEDAQKSSFTITSDYFLLEAGAKVDNAVFKLDSVLKRGSNNYMDVISRQYGGQK